MADNQFDMFDLPFKEDVKPDAKADATTDAVTLSKDQWDALNKRLADADRRSNEMFAQLFQGRQAPGDRLATPAAPSLAIDLNGLPDPRDDLEGYHKGLAERLGKTVQDVERHVTDRFTTQARTQSEVDGLWNTAWERFSGTHEDLAAFPELVQIASSQVMDELSQRSVDPMTLLRTNMDDMVGRVAEKTKALVERVRGTVEPDDDGRSGRTRVMDGSASRRGAKAPAAKPADDSWVKSIQKMQSEMGIY